MKRKILALMLVILFASGAWGAYYDEGNDGDSWETAYLIKSVEDLELMSYRVTVDGSPIGNGPLGSDPKGKYYKLASDINLDADMGWSGVGGPEGFSGHFDGQNHTIKINATISNPLFLTIKTGSYSNEIAVRNLNIEGNIATSSGSLIHTLSSGVIENCSFNGTLEGPFTGGLVYIQQAER